VLVLLAWYKYRVSLRLRHSGCWGWGIRTQAHRQQGHVISILLFFQKYSNKSSKPQLHNPELIGGVKVSASKRIRRRCVEQKIDERQISYNRDQTGFGYAHNPQPPSSGSRTGAAPVWRQSYWSRSHVTKDSVLFDTPTSTAGWEGERVGRRYTWHEG
jgi:hypothetical protein